MSTTAVTTARIVRSITELREHIRQYRLQAGPSAAVGLVPTMGFLHAGHASLIRRSAEENGLTVVSVFVNPLQFGPNEDFECYPRDEARDVAIASEAGANVLFMPEVTEMYPNPPKTSVIVSGITERLCGASRPGHFDGVGIVVSKLLNIVQPNRAYFGMKDAQQVAVITRMASDLSMPVDIVPCPIVRDSDGLALSSRNVYLSADERSQALILSQTLKLVPSWVEEGIAAAELTRRIRERIQSQPLSDIDYVEALEYPDLTPPAAGASLRTLLHQHPLLVAVAVRFGKTRLIDNILLTQKG
ncbi:pantoate--beta-alanine ligase [Cohnella lubricantis]|uniref:Pantothenate synthetase n=1 Tax=Cohnella lubricantis TaxID=2163172 RepID=A0A841TIH8_9BACL|nr:pantoate--beta-alanine ligase [Cohnella lubricantis]MBB6679679.1 pantoate--beta-alanine ligase [Cohnella lubricantis]MBP2119921.1 pantoate--beta-alanine ligase [Cohnella lubricantis]